MAFIEPGSKEWRESAETGLLAFARNREGESFRLTITVTDGGWTVEMIDLANGDLRQIVAGAGESFADAWHDQAPALGREPTISAERPARGPQAAQDGQSAPARSKLRLVASAATEAASTPENRADVLHGYEAIGRHLGTNNRRAKHLAETGGIPTFRLPKSRIICARRSTLDTWLAEQEAAAGRGGRV